MNEYTCENFKVPRQVEGRMMCSFKHLMGFKLLSKYISINNIKDLFDTLIEIKLINTIHN